MTNLLVNNEHSVRPRPHGNAYGKTHRINANAIVKKLPSTRNIHRIVVIQKVVGGSPMGASKRKAKSGYRCIVL